MVLFWWGVLGPWGGDITDWFRRLGGSVNELEVVQSGAMSLIPGATWALRRNGLVVQVRIGGLIGDFVALVEEHYGQMSTRRQTGVTVV